MLHDFQTEYREKLVTPDEAVKAVKSGDGVASRAISGCRCFWTELWRGAGMNSMT